MSHESEIPNSDSEPGSTSAQPVDDPDIANPVALPPLDDPDIPNPIALLPLDDPDIANPIALLPLDDHDIPNPIALLPLDDPDIANPIALPPLDNPEIANPVALPPLDNPEIANPVALPPLDNPEIANPVALPPLDNPEIANPVALPPLDNPEIANPVALPPTYNIIPLDNRDIPNPIALLPEVLDAIALLEYFPGLPQRPQDFPQHAGRNLDILDFLQYVFGFQKDSVSNQRENIVMLLADELSRQDHQNNEEAVTNVFKKTVENYTQWCLYLDTKTFWEEQEDPVIEHDEHDDHDEHDEPIPLKRRNKLTKEEKKILFFSLYYLIWGEAANVRHLPEGLCYIFHRMGGDMLDILMEPTARRTIRYAVTEDTSFLEQIIRPLYNVMAADAQRNGEGRASHSTWRNYDDFNELFWSRDCLREIWPLRQDSPFLSVPKNDLTVFGKTSFVERRTFLHLYHSFHRMWIFFVMIFQGLVILAWNDGQLNSKTLHEVLGIGRTYFVMKLVQSVLDIWLKYGAYSTTRCSDVIRIFVRFLWFLVATAFICILYMKGHQQKTSSNSASTISDIYTSVLVIYAGNKLYWSKWPLLPVSNSGNNTLVARLVMWICQEDCYVGRDLKVATTEYIKYMSIWVVILAGNFAYSYLYLISPLVIASKRKIDEPKNIHNVLAMGTLWLGVFCMYLLAFNISYTLISGLWSYGVGDELRIGQINSFKDFSERFDSFPQAFMDKLHIRETASTQNGDQALVVKQFSTFWNKILKKMRKEDYISNTEWKQLEMPESCELLFPVVQWPLFLLCHKLDKALRIATTPNLSQNEIWEEISRDKYMKDAVLEGYYIVKEILTSIFPSDGRNSDDLNANLRFEKVFEAIETSINEKTLLEKFGLHGLRTTVASTKEIFRLLQISLQDSSSFKIYQEIYQAGKLVSELLCIIEKDFPTSLATGPLPRPLTKPNDDLSFIQRPLIERLNSIIKGKHLEALNQEARRRLEFFTNSLFMPMPDPKPVSKMLSFSVLTPFCDETVLYSKEELFGGDGSDMKLFYYLTNLYKEEWNNCLARIECPEFNFETATDDLKLEVRLWASYRGQTLARTVRGTMYNLKALKFQSLKEKPIPQAASKRLKAIDEEAFPYLKFTYIAACQNYGKHKKKGSECENADIADGIASLLKRHKKLRVAFIEKSGEDFFSKLVKGTDEDTHGKEVYSIKLPGDPILGEGKPENQNHAIIFTRGYAVQTIDMNQDNYFEETLKMRNLLEEFRLNKATILGMREHIFTGRASSLASFMSLQETSFGTFGQRVFANPLKVRMHYGHPDVFDRVFHITRGGISKASRGINISEDIYAGYNSTLRNGNITHHEYIQVGKGRDVGFNQIAMFEGNVAGGNGEQVLSRDVYRLGQRFDFFRMLSMYFTTVGYYFSTLLVVINVYILLYGQLIRALSETSVRTHSIIKDYSLFMWLGVLHPSIYMILGSILEHGLEMVARKLFHIENLFCPVFFTFSLGTRMHWFGKTILHGGATYQATGRGFVIRHTSFTENYRRHSRSHFVKAMELFVLLYGSFWIQEATIWSYLWHVLSIIILPFSWLYAPFLFDPSCFMYDNCINDKVNMQKWLNTKASERFLSCINDKDNMQKWLNTKASKHDDHTKNRKEMEESWEAWWLDGLSDIRTPTGRVIQTVLSLRFFIFQYAVIKGMDVSWEITSWSIYVYRWLFIVAVILFYKIRVTKPRPSEIFGLFLEYITKGMLAIITIVNVVLPPTNDLPILLLFTLAVLLTGWGILSICVAWKSVLGREARLWNLVKCLAKFYDTAMGHMILFIITNISKVTRIRNFLARTMFDSLVAEGILAQDEATQSEAREIARM